MTLEARMEAVVDRRIPAVAATLQEHVDATLAAYAERVDALERRVDALESRRTARIADDAPRAQPTTRKAT